METEAGFYKVINGSLAYSGGSVISKSYKLEKAKKDTYTYPVDGWSWFETKAAALAAFPGAKVSL